MDNPLMTVTGRIKLTARPTFFLIVSTVLLCPTLYLGFTLKQTLAPYQMAQRLTSQVRWMPFYADLRFFRQSEGASGTENTLLVYAANGEALKSALDRIPIRRLETWKPGVDVGSYSELKYLAETLGLPAQWFPDSTAKTMLSCHTPFEAPGAERHWSFAIADTSRGMVWIGRSLSASGAPYLALEAFYQASNSQFKGSDLAEVGRKIEYLEASAPAEPGLSVLLALRHLQNNYCSCGPFKASSFKEGALEKAIEIQKQSLQKDKGFCLPYARLARYYSILEDFPSAHVNLEKAGACREDFHYLAAKAVYHLKMKELDSCRIMVARLESGKFPEKRFYPYEEIPLELARQEGNLVEMERNYTRLILHNPASPQPYGNFASYFLREFRYDEAMVLCDKVRELGEYSNASADCREAERKQERYGEKHGLLEETRSWAALLENGRDPTHVRMERARWLAPTDMGFLALEDIDFLMARKPSPDLALLKVRILDRLGEHEQATEVCADYFSGPRSSAGLDQACGISEYHALHRESAQRFLAKALAADRSMGQASLYLDFLKGDSTAGAAEALRLDGTVAEAWAVSGRQALAAHKYAYAESCYSRALAGDGENLDWRADRGEALVKDGKPELALPDLNRVLGRISGHASALRARVAAYRALGANGLAWADFKNLFRSGAVLPRDSAEFREWVATAALDTASLSQDPVFAMRSGFTRNILETKAIDHPDRLSLKTMRKRRVYLRMLLTKAAGKRYDFTYKIMDGRGSIMETGDLSAAPRTDSYAQWISYRFGQGHETPGDWTFDLYRKGELVVAQTIRMDL